MAIENRRGGADWKWWGAGIGTAAVVAALVWYASTGTEEPLEVRTAQDGKGRTSEPKDLELEPGFVMVGGVKRPISDVQATTPQPKPEEMGKEPQLSRIVPVKPDATPQVKSAVEAIRAKNRPERLSVTALPKAFDREAFAADPKTYLEVVEPGRVWQTAQPGPDVPRLGGVSPRFAEIAEGESVALQVSAPPGAPVTFTSFDLGTFEASQLTSITVQANDEGLAEAKFVASPGTSGDVHILAASPTASGQVKFVVSIPLSDR